MEKLSNEAKEHLKGALYLLRKAQETLENNAFAYKDLDDIMCDLEDVINEEVTEED